jgi:NAD(P)-dependent dehydrogenase (short-subunit alcohol dehydrogenase family)
VEAAAAALRKIHGKDSAVAMTVNVGDPAQVDALFASAKSEMGRVDILVNSAGVARISHFLEQTLADWELILRINLTGTFLCGQAAARLMAKNKPSSKASGQQRGAIVNIASISGQRGGTGRAAYGASKGGVIALTKVMAVDLAAHGIRVNAIAPGPIDTEMAQRSHTKETRAAYHRLVPQERYGSVEDIANAAVFLASDASGYVTGHTLNVDGGFGAAGLMFGDLPGGA